MHGILSVAIVSTIAAAALVIAGLLAYVEMTRSQLSIKSR
jgi:hypothetical protein